MAELGINSLLLSPIQQQQWGQNEEELRRQREALAALGLTVPEDPRESGLSGLDKLRMGPMEQQAYAARDLQNTRRSEALEALGTMGGGGVQGASGGSQAASGEGMPQSSQQQLRARLPEGVGDPVPSGVWPSAMQVLGMDPAQMDRIRIMYPDVEAVGKAGELYDKRMGEQQAAQQAQLKNKAISQLAYQLEGSNDPRDKELAQILNVYRNTGSFDDANKAIGSLAQQRLNMGYEDQRQGGRLELEGAKQENRMELENARFANQRALADFKSKLESEQVDKGDVFDSEMKLRKEVRTNPLVKDFQTISSNYRGITSMWNDYTSIPQEQRGKKSKIALDQALVNLFNKITDPGSVVRESEFARTAEGQALIERLKGMVPKLQAGGVGLTDAERQEMVNASGILYDAAKGGYQNVLGQYKGVIDQYSDLGVSADRVLRGLTGGELEATDINEERPGTGGNLPTVTSAEQYNALPPGAAYLDPNGNRRRKQ